MKPPARLSCLLPWVSEWIIITYVSDLWRRHGEKTPR